MRREYKAYINGAKITDGVNKIIVNGAECRRCLVNGVDIIKSFAQLKVQLTFNASVLIFSEYSSSCTVIDKRGFADWEIDTLTLSSLTNDFTILSANFRLSIAETTYPYADYRPPFLDSANRNFTSLPLTMNNVSTWEEEEVGQATYDMPWYLFAKFNKLSVRYEPTEEVFNVSNLAFLLQQGEIIKPIDPGKDTWSERLTFNISTELLVVEEAVSQY